MRYDHNRAFGLNRDILRAYNAQTEREKRIRAAWKRVLSCWWIPVSVFLVWIMWGLR